MRQIRVVLTGAVAASMVLGTMGAAMAQSTGQWESRADFIYQLDKAMGIKPVYPATPDFQDVPASNPYYGYIEAAYQLGITNGISQGVFGPTLALTRAEAAKYLVIAYGAASAAQSITSTSFGDNGNIPTALVGYVGEAAALGLMKGFPDGNFHPDANLSTVQEGYLVNQLTAAISSLSLTVTPSKTDVAPGAIVTLETSGTAPSGAQVAAPSVTYSVTGTNASSALISGDTFVGSAPGNYTVQATAGTATATAQISVFGTAAGLSIQAPQSVVANGQSTASVRVSVVDQNGNVVADSQDSITLDTGTGAVAGFAAGAPSTVAATDGVATFTLTAGDIAGASETLTATDASLAGQSATATIVGAAQVPTSLSLATESPYLTANGADGQDAVTAEVLDQTGNPMRSGADTVSFSVSGPATFSGASTAAGVYYGPSTSPAAATLSDVQGSTGAVTVTASATGLTSASASVTAVIAGAPSQIALSQAQTVSADLAGSGSGVTYSVTLEDTHGYPADWAGASSASITVTDASGAIKASASIPAGQDTAKVNFTESAVGSYALTASDTADGLASGTSSLTITPGAVAEVGITPGYLIYNPSGRSDIFSVPLSSPNWTETVQLEDQFGNPVQQSGVTVDLSLTADSGNSGSATINGQGSAAPGTSGAWVPVVTNAQGQAIAQIAAQPEDLDTYTTDVYLPQYPNIAPDQYGTIGGYPNLGGTIYDELRGAKVQLIQNAPTSGPGFALVNPSGTPVSSIVVDGTTYEGAAWGIDALGNAASEMYSDGCCYDYILVRQTGGTGSVSITDNGSSSAIFPGTDGTWLLESEHWLTSVGNVPIFGGRGSAGSTFGIKGEKAGPVTLTLTDVSVLGTTKSTTVTLTVSPGQSVHTLGFASNGTEVTALAPVTVQPGQEIPVTVTAEDQGNNPIVAASTVPVAVVAEQGNSAVGGEFRLTAGGSDLGASPVVDIPAGQTSATFYYVNDSQSAVQVNFDASGFPVSVAPVGTPAAVSAGQSETLTFQATDANGHPVSGDLATFSASTGTVTSTAVSDASGDFTVTFTAPSTGWNASSSATVTPAIQGVAGATASSATVPGK